MCPVQIKTYPINDNLILTPPQNLPSLSIYATSLILNKEVDKPSSYCLVFHVNSNFYENVITKSIFNLAPKNSSSSPFNKFKFLPGVNIEITASLKPDLLPLLGDNAVETDDIASRLLELNQSDTDHPLFFTESWFALSVKQQQPSGEVGYRTLWSYISPAALAQPDANSNDEISEGLINFFKDWAETNLTATTQTAAAQALESITSFLKQFADLDFDKFLDQIPDRFLEPVDEESSLLKTAIHFFTTDDWTFTKLQGHTVLHVVCQGQNGNWNCYAHVKESQQQFIFYSIAPVAVPEDKRHIIAEFLTRANYGMTIGNFELDYSDGEIRYKTSIDVEGDQLSTALIRQLVYTNVLMMDQYLPGILAVLEQGVSPQDAIALVES